MHILHAEQSYTAKVVSMTGRTSIVDDMGYDDARELVDIGLDDFVTKRMQAGVVPDPSAYVQGFIPAGSASPFNVPYTFGTNPTVVVMNVDPSDDTKLTNTTGQYLYNLNFTDNSLSELVSIDILGVGGVFDYDVYYKVTI